MQSIYTNLRSFLLILLLVGLGSQTSDVSAIHHPYDAKLVATINAPQFSVAIYTTSDVIYEGERLLLYAYVESKQSAHNSDFGFMWYADPGFGHVYNDSIYIEPTRSTLYVVDVRDPCSNFMARDSIYIEVKTKE